jgi:prepilin-type N-terminal cleavage/methylation domain-containing protein
MKPIPRQNRNPFARRAFTLAELLIVLAIIGVLVGVSIPIFNYQLEKSREATDIANMRAAKSLAVELFYSGVYDKTSAEANGMVWWEDKNGNNACGVYDPETGTITNVSPKNWPKAKAYGEGTASDGENEFFGYSSTSDYTGAVIQVTIYPEGAKTSLLKQFDGGIYSGKTDTPCIIVEWKNAGGDYVKDKKGNRIGYIIFLDA